MKFGNNLSRRCWSLFALNVMQCLAVEWILFLDCFEAYNGGCLSCVRRVICIDVTGHGSGSLALGLIMVGFIDGVWVNSTCPFFVNGTHFIKLVPVIPLMIRAHSFPRKILPNSVGQLAKIRGSLQQQHPNSAARHSLPLWLKTKRAVQKLQLLKAKWLKWVTDDWCLKCPFVILNLNVLTEEPKCSVVRKFKWPEITVITVSLVTPTIVFITGHFSNSTKFCGNVKILRQKANSAARLKIPRPAENCRPYSWSVTVLAAYCSFVAALSFQVVDHS